MARSCVEGMRRILGLHRRAGLHCGERSLQHRRTIGGGTLRVEPAAAPHSCQAHLPATSVIARAHRPFRGEQKLAPVEMVGSKTRPGQQQ
jgi:hypothetical protein